MKIEFCFRNVCFWVCRFVFVFVLLFLVWFFCVKFNLTMFFESCHLNISFLFHHTDFKFNLLIEWFDCCCCWTLICKCILCSVVTQNKTFFSFELRIFFCCWNFSSKKEHVVVIDSDHFNFPLTCLIDYRKKISIINVTFEHKIEKERGFFLFNLPAAKKKRWFIIITSL